MLGLGIRDTFYPLFSTKFSKTFKLISSTVIASILALTKYREHHVADCGEYSRERLNSYC
jgi:hypothetical protein